MKKSAPIRTLWSHYITMGVSPELMFAVLLARLGSMDPGAYATFVHGGRPLLELARYVFPDDHTLFNDVLSHLDDPAAVLAWAEHFVSQKNHVEVLS